MLAAVFASRIGTTEVASHEIGVQIWSFFSLALDAVAIAGQAMVAKELGASRPDVARAASVRMIGMSIQLSAVFGLALVLLRGPLASIFSNDPAVVALSGFILLFVAVAQPVNAAAFAFDGIYIGAGDSGLSGMGDGLVQPRALRSSAARSSGWPTWASAGCGQRSCCSCACGSAPQWIRFRSDTWLRTGAA